MDFPQQLSTDRAPVSSLGRDAFDVREYLSPRRLSMAMWDQAFLCRHMPGGSFHDFGRVLDETIERGYNVVRLDPMPQWIDLAEPERELAFAADPSPLMPWGWNQRFSAPLGRWLIDFMAEMQKRRQLYYTLSAWWFWKDVGPTAGPKPRRIPRTHLEAAEMWIGLLQQWKQWFGFERLLYIDLANEIPYFLPGFVDRFERETGGGWHSGPFTPQQIGFLAAELNPAMRLLQREFPDLRFTASIHGDLRWLDVPVEFDCLDVHFYADADPRWTHRTRFNEFMPHLFKTTDWHAEFSHRCGKAAAAIAPMLRQRQRAKLSQFAAWAERRGVPLTTTESWASWFMIDSPDLDWGWLLEWAAWSVEDAIDHRMWGWTPHNYVQPQFANWQDVAWHQRLTSRFLNS